jgi:signal transduction histidine kinase
MADYRALAEQDVVGRFVARDGAFVYVNERLAAMAGESVDALVGRDPLSVVSVPGARDAEAGTGGVDADEVRALLRGQCPNPDEGLSHRLRITRRDGPPVGVTARFARIEYEGAPATLCVVVPPTASRSYAVSVLERATAELVGATTRDEVCAVAVETAVEVFGFAAVSVHTRDDDGTLTSLASSDGAVTIPDVPPDDGPVWGAFLTGEARVVPGEAAGLDAAFDLVAVPVGETELLLAAASGDRRLDATVEPARLLATNVAAALDRVRRERRLERLHEATRSLMAAETVAEVADVAVATARDVLRHDICGVHLYDADRDALVPAAASERTRAFLGSDGELPAFERGESLTFAAFEAGETRVYDRVDEVSGVMNPETHIRSELIVPLGDRGVFLAGSALPAAFDETDVSLAKVLCSNVEAALDRAEREAAFREQRSELEERNDRLDEFASVVSHDLRNPLNVAQGRLELAREACEAADAGAEAADHFDAVAESHERMADLVDDLLTLARQGRGVGETERVEVGSLARTCWEGFSGGDLVVADDVAVEADRTRLRELLENLLRNAVEHAGPEPTVRVGALDGDAGVAGFYVADDGPGIPPDERERVFEHGYSTDPDGTGFGLAIVGAVADAHGWDVRLTEGEAGGARFEFRF